MLVGTIHIAVITIARQVPCTVVLPTSLIWLELILMSPKLELVWQSGMITAWQFCWTVLAMTFMLHKTARRALELPTDLGYLLTQKGMIDMTDPPGQGNSARGTGSLGVFVDLAGADKYRAGIMDGQAQATSTFGVSFDKESLGTTNSGGGEPHVPPKPGSIPMPGKEELSKIYQLATQWGVGSAQEAVQENTDRLIGIGIPAFEWMLEQHLATADRLQLRTFVAVAKALGADAGSTIGPKALGGTKIEKRHVIQIAIDARILDIGSILGSLLDDPELQDIAARAAGGRLKAVGCLNELNRLCLSEDRILARSAMVSINQIGSIDSVGTAQGMLRSADFLTRKAAEELLQKFPEKAKDVGVGLVSELDESRVRLGLRLLAGSGDLRSVATMLLDPRPGVRIECLILLDGRCPSEFVQAFQSLSTDPVVLVRSVARKLKPTKS